MSRSRNKSIGNVVGAAFIIGSFFASRAIGTALGFHGFTGIAVGSGIIAAGLVGLVAVSVCGYLLAKGCISLINRARDYFHSRADEQERAAPAPMPPSPGNTRNFARPFFAAHDNQPSVAPSAPPLSNPVQYPPEYFQPPAYQADPNLANAPFANPLYEPFQPAVYKK